MDMGCQQDSGSVEHGWIETFIRLFADRIRKLPCWGLPVGHFRLLIKRCIDHLLVQRWVKLGICKLRGFRVCKRHGQIVFYMAKDMRKRQDPMAGWLWTSSKQWGLSDWLDQSEACQHKDWEPARTTPSARDEDNSLRWETERSSSFNSLMFNMSKIHLL